MNEAVMLAIVGLAMGLFKLVEWLIKDRLNPKKVKKLDGGSATNDQVESVLVSLAEVEEDVSDLNDKVSTIILKHETCNEECRKRIAKLEADLAAAQERERLLYKDSITERDAIIKDQESFADRIIQGLGGKRKRSQRSSEVSEEGGAQV